LTPELVSAAVIDVIAGVSSPHGGLGKIIPGVNTIGSTINAAVVDQRRRSAHPPVNPDLDAEDGSVVRDRVEGEEFVPV